MKRRILCFLAVTIGISANPALLLAQINPASPPVLSNEAPVVTVLATAPNASEDGPSPGTFQLTRTGDTTSPLTVYYGLGGSAHNGRDYQMLPGYAIIPIGSASTSVAVTPILDVDRTSQTNDTVVLQLHPLVDFFHGSPAGYALGWPSNAVVTIAESTTPPTNQPPLVQLISPSDGAGFIAPANLQLVAQARDLDGTVTNIEFFAGTTSLGNESNLLIGERFRGLYSLDWTNVAAGTYLLTATATDNQGAHTTSGPVSIKVLSAADVPRISVMATDDQASELGPEPGTFTVTRTGDMTGALSVYYTLGGTARNGSDYQRLPGVVNFAAGAPTATVKVTPIPDLDPLGHTNDTVILQLRPLLGGLSTVSGIYNLGSPSNAVVTITENASAFPVVTVTASDPNAGEDRPDTGTFQVTRVGNTADPLTVYYSLGGTAHNGRDYQMLPGYVMIPAGATSTNITLTPILDRDSTAETNETVVLQLRPLTDFMPSRTSSYALGWPSNAVVNIAESTKPPVNQPPLVHLLNPIDGGGFVAPADIQLLAQAQDSDGTVTNVQFFSGSTSLGTVTNSPPQRRDRGLFSLNWTNVSVGQFVLTAVATDNQGATATSGPVHIVITQTALPTVSVFASNPIAITGTNAMGNTNSAQFVVRRSLGTNADLVVYYSISGTASNGVDYVKLPGSVTIPAGSSTASIQVDPLINPAQSNRTDTVILTVQPPPTTGQNPPSYQVSRFNQATAVVIDRARSHLGLGWLGQGMFHVVLPAADSARYRVEVSSNLLDWQAVSTNSGTQGTLQFVDPDSINSPLRFYRVVPETSGSE